MERMFDGFVEKAVIGKMAGIIAVTIICVLLAGCEGPDSVSGEPRESTSQPIFYDYNATGDAVADNPDTENQSRVSFLYDDCFAVFRVEVAELTRRSELADVEWSDLSKELANWIGESNADFKKIQYAWILLDRAKIQMGGDSAESLPFSIVLDYMSATDDQDLADAIASMESESDQTNESSFELRIEAFGKKQILIGDSVTLAKMKNSNGPNELTRLVGKWDEGGNANAAIAFAPIRPTLQSLFDMVANFSEEAKRFSDLPQSMRDIQMSFDLDSENLAQVEFSIEDQKMVDEIAIMINSTLQAPSSGAGAASPMGMMSMAMGGAKPPEAMFDSTSMDVLGKVAEDIKTNALIRVESKEEQVYLRLSRPAKLNDLIRSVVGDAQKQLGRDESSIAAGADWQSIRGLLSGA